MSTKESRPRYISAARHIKPAGRNTEPCADLAHCHLRKFSAQSRIPVQRTLSPRGEKCPPHPRGRHRQADDHAPGIEPINDQRFASGAKLPHRDFRFAHPIRSISREHVMKIMKRSCPLVRLRVRELERDPEQFDRVSRCGVVFDAKSVCCQEAAVCFFDWQCVGVLRNWSQHIHILNRCSIPAAAIQNGLFGKRY